jgi:hypothetical protein
MNSGEEIMSNAKISNFVITTAFLSATLLNPAVIYNRDARVISFAGAGPGPTATSTTPPPAVTTLIAPDTTKSDHTKLCQEQRNELAKTKAAYNSACTQVLRVQAKSSGIKANNSSLVSSCKKKLDECRANEEAEQSDGPMSGMLGEVAHASGTAGELFDTYTNFNDADSIQCPQYNAADYEKQEKKVQDAIDKAKTDLEKTQKAQADLRKEAPEKLAKLKSDMVADKEKYENEVSAEAEKKRNEEASIAEQQAKMNEEIQNLDAQMLSARSDRSKLIGSRSVSVENYKLELLGCKSMRQQKRAEQRKNANTAGSLATANSAGKSSSSEIDIQYGVCVRSVLKKRNLEGENYRNEMQKNDLMIAQLDQKKQNKESAIQLLKKQASEANQGRTQAAYQRADNVNKNLAIKQNQLEQMAAQYQKDDNDLSIQIAKQEAMVNSKSNALQKLIPIKPKADVKKSSADVDELMNSFLSGAAAYISTCSDAGAATDETLKKDIQEMGGTP